MLSDDFLEKLNSVTKKRARFVIDKILEQGFCSTQDLKDGGYEHAPRAARDVRKMGIPLITFKVKDRNGKSIAAYKFGDWEEAKRSNKLARTGGRTQLNGQLKKALIDRYGCRCYLYGEEYPSRLLQPDHRIPYEIGGDPYDMNNLDCFMLLSPSANRDKSWACEHCEKWKIRDVEFCKSCYYAFPEHYEHIAGKQEKKIELVFENDDIDIYNKIVEIADEHSLSSKDVIKRLLQYAKSIDKENKDD